MKSKILLVILLCFMLVGAMGLVDAKKKTYDSLTQTVNLDSSFLGIKTGVSATDWDNKLNYEQDTKTIIVKNTFGLGRDLIKAQLTDNFCTGGRFCEADKTIELFEEGVLIEDFKTLRLDDFSKEEQNIRWYKLEYFGIVEDFETQCTYKNITTNGTYEEQICEQIKTGTHNDWIQFKEGDVFSKGIYQVRTTGEIKPGRVYDWQIKIEGKWTTPWAIWGNISTGDDAEVILNSPVNGSVSLTNLVTFNVTANVTGGATLVNMSLFTNETGNWEIRLDTFVNGDSSPDISDLIYSNNNFDLSTESTNPFQLKLKPDGTKLYIFDKISFIIYQYSLSTPWNITTASYDSKFKTVNTQDTEPRDFWIKPDGTKIYILGGTNHAIYQYTLTTPWDISTYTYDSKSKVSETNLRFIYLTPDGTKLWVGCDNNKGIYQHILSTPWDISTAGVSSNAITFGTKLNAPNSLMVSSDGKSIYPNGLVNKKMFEWNLSTAYDLSTGTFVNEYAMAEDSTPTGTAIGTNNVIYQLGDTTDTAYQYILPSRERTITDDIIWNVQACDSDGDCGFAPANYSLFLDTTAPTISITSPNETFDYGKVNKSLDFNITVTDTNLDTCWYDYNSTNITFSCTTGVKATEKITQELSNFSVIVYANDTIGNENSTSVNWNYKIFENANVFNTTTYETAWENFTANFTANASLTAVTLDWNGTDKVMTQSVENWTTAFDIPLDSFGNLTMRYKFTYGAETIYGDYFYQNVSATNFSLCTAGLTDDFLDISFKDEGNLSEINGSIPTATFNYYLGSGTISKNYTYTNTTTNTNFLFCAQPDRTLFVDSVVQFKQGTEYPQRIWDPSVQTYTSTSTNQILYLLSTADGIFVTFQVLNIAEQTISDVIVNATRTIEGSTVVVADGITDSAGSVTFWLNPDFKHTISFVKSGFTTQSTTIFPTQPLYTISLGAGATVPLEDDLTKGVSYSIKPSNNSLNNNTIYNFNFTVSSVYWEVEVFGFNLKYKNGTTIGSTSATTNGGVVSLNGNVSNSSIITMNAYYTINGTNYTTIKTWRINFGDSSYSINNFFKRFNTYLDADLLGVKGDAGNSDFGKALISFFILVLTVGTLSFRYGIASEGAIMGIIFGIVLFLDVGIGLIPSSIMGMDHLITVITGLIVLGIVIKEEVR